MGKIIDGIKRNLERVVVMGLDKTYFRIPGSEFKVFFFANEDLTGTFQGLSRSFQYKNYMFSRLMLNFS